MPVGGVQSQNPTQGLVHWMSAVMAEHMTSNSHHDPTVGMHYMWNGGVDVSFTYNFSFLFSAPHFAAPALSHPKSPTMTYDSHQFVIAFAHNSKLNRKNLKFQMRI